MYRNFKNSNASVSVVIPCYNCAETILRSIYSVLLQSFPANEIILINDASIDNTLEVINELQNKHPQLIKIFSLSKNGGVAQARNIGWDNSTSTYVAFLDADDTWHPEKLSIQVAHMQDKPYVVASGHFTVISNPEVKGFEKIPNKLLTKLLSNHSFLFFSQFPTSSVMLKRELLLRFPSEQRYCEDIRLWQKIVYENYIVSRIDYVLSFAHKPLWGSSGLSSHMYAMERGELLNIIALFNECKIGFFLMLLAISWSILKFIRRLLLCKFNNFFGFTRTR